jgi:translation elongation factor EF-4
MAPDESPREVLGEGEIGYIVTGIKKAGIASVGDTVTTARNPAPELHGYKTPEPVIWASVYPESQDDLLLLRQSLERLRLSDSSLSYEEESSGVMGRGFRCGFLGMLHLEIIIERLKREFTLALVVTMPTTVYEITYKDGRVEDIYAPARFPTMAPQAACEKCGRRSRYSRRRNIWVPSRSFCMTTRRISVTLRRYPTAKHSSRLRCHCVSSCADFSTSSRVCLPASRRFRTP